MDDMGPPSSRSEKRKGDDETAGQPSAKRVRSGTSFTSTTREGVKSSSNQRCTHCTAEAPDVAHVFAQTDTNFDDAKTRGLVSLQSRGDAENAIALCGNCNRSYDNHWNPGLVIAPTHLDFFHRAESLFQAGQHRARIPPTSVQYAEYCHTLDASLDVGKGGQYTFYMDTPFLGPFSLQPGTNLVRQWTGDPMAMLYRAMHASRQTIEPRGLPVAVQDRLLALDDLYRRGSKLLASRAASTVEGTRPDAGAVGLGQDDDTANSPRPGPAAFPAVPRAGPPSAAPAPNGESNYTANRRDTLQTAKGIPSPPSSFIPSPDTARISKRKRDDTTIEVAVESETGRKRAKVDVTETSGLDHVWSLFWQSTDAPSPDVTPDVNTSLDIASIACDPPQPKLYNTYMDEEMFWKWQGRTAADAVAY